MMACPGGSCPLKADCLRYRRVVHGRRSIFGAAPYDATTGTCAHFAPIDAARPTDDQIRERAYHLWLSSGRPDGHADANWSQARSELEASFLGELRAD